MRIIIAGGRDFKDFELMKDKLDKLLPLGRLRITVLSGRANGADKLGERYAHLRNLNIDYYPARWDIYGIRAGFMRNEEMAGKATHLFAFWDGKSKGTKHMIDTARKKGLVTIIIRY
jgi:hypothetical protein